MGWHRNWKPGHSVMGHTDWDGNTNICTMASCSIKLSIQQYLQIPVSLHIITRIINLKSFHEMNLKSCIGISVSYFI